MKLRYLSLIAIAPIITTPCILSTSCNSSILDKSITGDNWEGHITGAFDEADYEIDEEEGTVTYWNSQTIVAENLVVPDYVVYNAKQYKVIIGEQCFYQCKTLKGSIELNNWTTDIPNDCFYEDVNITKVILHNYPQKIGDYAFFRCYSLASIVVNNDVQWTNNLVSIGDCAFESTKISGDLFFPKTFKSIGERAFSNCIYITKALMGFCDELKVIKPQSFSNCMLMTEVEFPKSIEKICNGAFRYCSSLEWIDLPIQGMSIVLEDFAFFECPEFTGFSNKCDLPSIGKGCFFHNSKLQFNPWTCNTTRIGEDAFASCDFKNIELPKNFSDIVVQNGAWSDNLELKRIDVSKLETIPTSWEGQDFFASIVETGQVVVSEAMCSVTSPVTIRTDWMQFFNRFGLIFDATHWTFVLAS